MCADVSVSWCVMILSTSLVQHHRVEHLLKHTQLHDWLQQWVRGERFPPSPTSSIITIFGNSLTTELSSKWKTKQTNDGSQFGGPDSKCPRDKLVSTEQVLRASEARILTVINFEPARRERLSGREGFLCLPSSKLFVQLWQFLLLACKLQLRADQTPLEFGHEMKCHRPCLLSYTSTSVLFFPFV